MQSMLQGDAFHISEAHAEPFMSIWFLSVPKLLSACMWLCTWMALWSSGRCCFSMPDPREWRLPSRKHLACNSAFVLSFFFFFPLTCCRWPCRTCALLCSLPTLKSQAQEASGCSRAAWGILLADYLCFILLHSGTKPWKKSHLTSLGSTDPHHPSLSALEMQAIPPLSAQVSSCCLHHLGAGFSGQGEFIRFAFPLLIALLFMSPGRGTASH